MDVANLYHNRFDNKEILIKNHIWKILCSNFFNKYINFNDVILDLGSGYCEFINNIGAQKKIAVDINNDTKHFANKDVEVFIFDFVNTKFFKSNTFDVVFISNFFEHLKDKIEILRVLQNVREILKTNGILLILQPNIKYLTKEYWDFFDHNIALSDKSMCEALKLAGFNIKLAIPKFLPYTFKSKLPKSDFLLKLYLNLPFLWQIFGKQMFIIAQKP